MVIHPLEVIETRDWLAFAGIGNPHVQLIAGEQQFAERAHAYAQLRDHPNNRVKDVMDMALLIDDSALDRIDISPPWDGKFSFRHENRRGVPSV